jgi:uncharacterized membrane protein YhaH (DUF805 family)
MSFDSLFADPRGRTGRGPFLGALMVLLAAAAFYVLLTRGRNSEWVLMTLLFPAFVLHARRLHDMGRTAWLLLVPLAVALAAFAVWLRLVSFGAGLDGLLAPAAAVLGAAFALWGLIGQGQAEANRFGVAAG